MSNILEGGHDLTYQATHGTLQPPTMPTVPVADMLGAERAVSEALAALIATAKSGTGQVRRVVLEEAATDEELSRVFATRTDSEWETFATSIDVHIVAIRTRIPGAAQ